MFSACRGAEMELGEGQCGTKQGLSGGGRDRVGQGDPWLPAEAWPVTVIANSHLHPLGLG